jgi:predicted NUDIX family NTP pyrophosphohydrolase
VNRSAGVLLYRRAPDLEVLLVHPGGPYWVRKDAGAWQIPKGGIGEGEESAIAAVREVREELGLILEGQLQPLGEIRQAGGKWVEAFALEHDFDPAHIRSIEFEMEWPPRSGKTALFPEVDAARWMSIAQARKAMLPSQLPLLDRLEAAVG